MASSFFKQFAIENHLTVDYGYLYGKYKNFYISVKETIGSSKYLVIITQLAQDKEKLKKVLSTYGEELPKYCICDMKREDNYLQFTFSLSNDNASLIVEFLDKFIEAFTKEEKEVKTTCPLCHKELKNDEQISWIDYQGVLTPTHDDCFGKKAEELKETIKEHEKQINKDRHNYFIGFLGTFVFALIYVGVLILGFFFIQFILNNASSSSSNIPFEDVTMSLTILQYAPVLLALCACPLCYTGYELFKGKKGTGKFLIVLFTSLIATLVGTFLGFVISLTMVATDQSLKELFELVATLLKPTNGYKAFRSAFYVYIAVGVILSIISMLFKFSNKKELEEANATTIEKLD